MINYPVGVKKINKSKVKRNKYHNTKVSVKNEDGEIIKFDSKAEAMYYKKIPKTKLKNVKLQVAFELMPKFELLGKKYRAIKYIPDFVFYDDAGNIEKVVDVKGKQTEVFKIKAKLFCGKYQIPLVLAKYDYKKKTFEESIF